MKKIVLLRHRESLWNKENRFTGWTDVELSEKAILEAKNAGQVLRDAGFIHHPLINPMKDIQALTLDIRI